MGEPEEAFFINATVEALATGGDKVSAEWHGDQGGWQKCRGGVWGRVELQWDWPGTEASSAEFYPPSLTQKPPFRVCLLNSWRSSETPHWAGCSFTQAKETNVPILWGDPQPAEIQHSIQQAQFYASAPALDMAGLSLTHKTNSTNLWIPGKSAL